MSRREVWTIGAGALGLLAWMGRLVWLELPRAAQGDADATGIVLASASSMQTAMQPAMQTASQTGLPGSAEEESLRNYFHVDNRLFFHYDPLAYLLNDPDQRRPNAWPEHPRGRFWIVTNDMGFREDLPTALEPRGPRVLVAGDSHTQGMVDNRDSFANLAEALLQQSLQRPEIEVINAGVSFTGPRCYLGVLRKYLVLQPRVFVAVLFAGNDFADDLLLRYHLEHRYPPEPPGYRERVVDAARRWPYPIAQGLNQVYRWKHFPVEPDLALQAVLDSVLEMQRVCAESGVAFLLVLLPTKMDVDRDDRENWTQACRELGLEPEDAAMGLEVGECLLARARAAGIECLDPTSEMRAADETLYWRTDYHLGLAGHRLLAELLADRLRTMIE